VFPVVRLLAVEGVRLQRAWRSKAPPTIGPRGMWGTRTSLEHKSFFSESN